METTSYLDSELYVTSSRQARFSCGGREDLGDLELDGQRLAARQKELTYQPQAFGSELFAALFPAGGPLREGFREALASARASGARLRLRLHVAPSVPAELHGLAWELLYDAERGLAIGRSPDTAFSRYSAVRADAGRPVAGRLRLLCLVSAPQDAAEYGMAEIDRATSLERLARTFEAFGSIRLEVDLLEPPATPGRLRERLQAGAFHALHVFGHGRTSPRTGSELVLENDDGTAAFVGEDVLAEIFLGDRELRLVTLAACHGGASSSPDEALSGLAGRLVGRGVPAVVGMRRAVKMTTVHIFTEHLYRGLARTGRVDAAVNEARQQLFLAEPETAAWSYPMLFLRLRDGLLWQTGESRPAPAEAAPAEAPAAAVRRHLRWAILVLLALVLGSAGWPPSEAEVGLDLYTSSVTFKLAKKQPVVERFSLRELAVSGLEELTLPRSLSREPLRAEGVPVLGILAKITDESGGITLQPTLLPGGTRVTLARLDSGRYNLRLSDSPELVAALDGKVSLQVPPERPIEADLERIEHLKLRPRKGGISLHVVFSGVTGEEMHRPIAVSGLRLARVEEKDDSDESYLATISTLISGTVSFSATGAGRELRKEELLTYSRLSGTLYELDADDDGIHVGFRGKVSDLAAKLDGGEPRSLMPTRLELWTESLREKAALLLSALLLSAAILTYLERAALRAWLAARQRLVITPTRRMK